MKKRLRLYFLVILGVLLLTAVLLHTELSAKRLFGTDGKLVVEALDEDAFYMLHGFISREEGDFLYRELEIELGQEEAYLCMMNPGGFLLTINGEAAEKYSERQDNLFHLEGPGNYVLSLRSPRLVKAMSDDAGLYIGTAQKASQVLERRLSQRVLVVGVNVMALLYSISLYLNKPTEKYLLFFMAYVFLTSYRTIGRTYPEIGIGVNLWMDILHFCFPNFSGPVLGALKMLLVSFFNPMIRFLILREFLPEGSKKGHYIRCILLAFFISVLAVFIHPSDACLLSVGHIYKIVVFSIELWVLTGMAKQGPIMIWAWLIGLAVMNIELLNKLSIIESVLFTQFGTTGIYESMLVISFLLAVNRKFAGKFEEADYLNRSLESAVNEKTAELQASYALLQKAQEEQEMFFSDIAHNLKTPLFSISGYTDMLLEMMPPEVEKARKYGQNIRSTAEYMRKLLESLLLSMRLCGRNVEFSKDVFSPGDMLGQVRECMLPKAAERGIDILLEEPVSRQKFVSDSFYLFQALQNLVENAIDCGKEGGHVWLKMAIDESGLSIRVQDDGIGIPQEDRQRIFERYYSRRRDGRKSSGLGLSIVKDIVEQQGGSIRVESEVGNGSCFSLYFPQK